MGESVSLKQLGHVNIIRVLTIDGSTLRLILRRKYYILFTLDTV